MESAHAQRQPTETYDYSSTAVRSSAQNETNATSAASELGSALYAQLREDQQHKFFSEGNQKVLITERLNSMRGLLKGIQETDWMFEGSGCPYGIHGGNGSDHGNGNVHGQTLYGMSGGEDKRDKNAPQPMGRGVERHFSLGRRVS